MQLSNRAFTEEVLALGLKYTGTSKEIRTLYFIAAAEVTASHLDEEMAQQLRLGVSSILNSARLQKENRSGKLHKAIRTVGTDKDIIVHHHHHHHHHHQTKVTRQ